MALPNHFELNEPMFPKGCPEPEESVMLECARLIHAAVINRHFLNKLLANPLKTIEDGFCGEKFAFTREEKQRINRIHAASLADFSRQLILAMEHSANISAASEMAYARWESQHGLSA